MLKIDIVSGFLGAGKTTFIKRILKTNINKEKIVLIENEFGDVNIDSDFMAGNNIEISEISSGCICCSLVGDFSKNLSEIIDKYNPDRIIVEPSGVGKLSDVIKAVFEANLGDYLNTYVCIVDASKAKVYAKNFKEFFADQIANAKTVLLSRCDVASSEKINSAIEVVRGLNEGCNLITTNIMELSDEVLLEAYEGHKDRMLDDLMEEVKHHHHHDEECTCGHHEHHHHDEECSCGHHEDHHHDEECSCGHHEHHHDEECTCGHPEHHHHDEECTCGHHEHHHDEECSCGHHHHHQDEESTCGHHHHHHDEECSCGHHHHHHDEECSCGHHEHHHNEECTCGHHHHHHAEEVFNSIGLETNKTYNYNELNVTLNNLANTSTYGMIVRAKGIVKTDLGWKKFNITPNELLVEDNEAIIIGKVCVIGTHLDENIIKGLF